MSDYASTSHGPAMVTCVWLCFTCALLLTYCHTGGIVVHPSTWLSVLPLLPQLKSYHSWFFSCNHSAPSVCHLFSFKYLHFTVLLCVYIYIQADIRTCSLLIHSFKNFVSWWGKAEEMTSKSVVCQMLVSIVQRNKGRQWKELGGRMLPSIHLRRYEKSY